MNKLIKIDNEIASQAFEVLGKRPKITFIPLMARSLIVKFAMIFTSVKLP